jgi:hypothetical protein
MEMELKESEVESFIRLLDKIAHIKKANKSH